MKRLGAMMAIIVAGTGLAAARPSRAASRVAIESTVWDSVFTAEQAVRGDTLYKSSCSKCHGATLAGTDDGNPLTGANFLANWNGLSVFELADKIRTTMPPEKPKSISGPQLADVVAYLLAQNQFPAGTKTLSDSADAQKAIKIVQSKP
jgi:mono/diheme cytochrome c family protein